MRGLRAGTRQAAVLAPCVAADAGRPGEGGADAAEREAMHVVLTLTRSDTTCPYRGRCITEGCAAPPKWGPSVEYLIGFWQSHVDVENHEVVIEDHHVLVAEEAPRP